MSFTSPRVQALYDDLEAIARTNVAVLRMRAGDNPDAPWLASLVGELSLVSPSSGNGGQIVTSPIRISEPGSFRVRIRGAQARLRRIHVCR